MRGKACCALTLAYSVGITPAYAGKRQYSQPNELPAGDHPRVCGEKGRRAESVTSGLGSPPRMRGKDSQHLYGKAADRITPAYAGKRPRFLSGCGVALDHPRVCGEKSTRPVSPRRSSGSPPRMRGKAGSFLASHPELRITPAYAGKRLDLAIVRFARQDHPRVCGEKRFLLSSLHVV